MGILHRASATLVSLALTAVALTVSATPSHASSDVVYDEPDSLVMKSAPTRRIAKVNVTLVIVQTADKTAAQTRQINVTTAKNSVASASGYWRDMSNGRLSMHVGKTITGFRTKARSNWDADTILSTVQKELRWKQSPRTALVVFIPGHSVVVHGKSGYSGLGMPGKSDSARILMPYTSTHTKAVMIHEAGHLFGLHHADALQCRNGAADTRIVKGKMTNSSCYNLVYGDANDVMGANRDTLGYLNAAMFDYGAFGRGNEILNLGKAKGYKAYTLTPWAGSAARRAVKFTDPKTGETYYVQLRMPVGWDRGTAVGGNRGVEILKVGRDKSSSLVIPPSTRPYNGWYNTKQAWQAGKTFTTAGGTKVIIKSIGLSSAVVSIKAG